MRCGRHEAAVLLSWCIQQIEAATNGLDEIGEALRILLNTAKLVGAGHYERSRDRRNYANDFKPKRVRTHVGALELRVPHGASWSVLPFLARARHTIRARVETGTGRDARKVSRSARWLPLQWR